MCHFAPRDWSYYAKHTIKRVHIDLVNCSDCVDYF